MTSIRSQIDSGRLAARMFFGVAVAFAALGIWLLVSPPLPPFSGKVGRLHQLAIAIIGPHGPGVMWLALAAFAVMVARSAWRHTPKLPSDRLLCGHTARRLLQHVRSCAEGPNNEQHDHRRRHRRERRIRAAP